MAKGKAKATEAAPVIRKPSARVSNGKKKAQAKPAGPKDPRVRAPLSCCAVANCAHNSCLQMPYWCVVCSWRPSTS